MGVGKTTIGKQLAKKYNMSFTDTDREIERIHKNSIVKIFKNHGEEIFRKMEESALRNIPENNLVSCGGGLPTHNNNMDFIKESGLSIYLKASKDKILERLYSDYKKRPLIQNKSEKDLKEFIKKTLAKREKFYLMADYTIDTTNLSVRDVLRKIDSLRISI